MLHHWSVEVDAASIEVVELDTGVAVAAHADGIVLFKPGAPHKTRLIKDDRLAGAPLYRDGGMLLAEIGGEMFRVKLKEKP